MDSSSIRVHQHGASAKRGAKRPPSQLVWLARLKRDKTPPNATHFSRTLMAEAVGISPSSVGRIWKEAG